MAADTMACDGQTLIVMNYDETIWRYTGGSSFTQYASAGGAAVIG